MVLIIGLEINTFRLNSDVINILNQIFDLWKKQFCCIICRYAYFMADKYLFWSPIRILTVPYIALSLNRCAVVTSKM